MTLVANQIMEIRRTVSGRKSRIGSGYAVDQQTVLTAAHVVAPGDKIEVRPLGQTNRWFAVAETHRHSSADLAVLRLSEDDRLHDVVSPPLGTTGTDGDTVIPVELAGFPRVQRRESGLRVDEWVHGDLLPLSAQRASTLSIDVHTALPRRTNGTQSPWGGISGAPVFAYGSYLTAVVVHDHQGYEGRLEAVAIHRALAEDPAFAQFLPTVWHTRPPVDLADRAVWAVDEELSIQIKAPTTPLSPLIEDRLQSSPLELITARHALVPFIEREELSQLCKKFLEPESLLQIGLLYGPAGSGKSRLANELYKVAREAGWSAGEIAVRAPVGADQFKITKPTLLIFDYAETQVLAINHLLNLILNMGQTPKIRILLLARTGEGPWLAALKRNLALGSSIPDVCIGLTHTHLDPPSRDGHYDLAAMTFGRLLSVTRSESSARPDLSGEMFGLPLLVHIRALLDILAGGIAPMGDSTTALLDKLLDREWEKYWEPAFAAAVGAQLPVDATTAAELVALASLAGAADGAEAKELLRAATDLADTNDLLRAQLAKVLSSLYTGGSYLPPVQPDLLGEYLVGKYLLDVDRLVMILGRCSSPQQKARVIEVLVRIGNSPILSAAGYSRGTLHALLERTLPDLVRDAISATVRRETRGRATERASISLPRTLAEALAATPEPVAAATMVVDLPTPKTPELIDLAIRLGTQSVAHLNNTGDHARAAEVSVKLAEALITAGDPAAAVGFAQRGANLSRGFAAARPELTPQLAGAQAMQALAEMGLGHIEEGRKFAQDAVDQLTAQAERDPDLLATALSTLSMTLISIRDYPRAIATAREAVELLERQPGRGTQDHDIALAAALVTQGTILQIGGHREAIDSVRRAVSLLREHTADDPSRAVGVQLIGAECLLAAMYAGHGDAGEAAAAALSATTRARELDAESDADLRHLVAGGEIARAIAAMVSGDKTEAVDAVRAAVEIYDVLSINHPSMFAAPLMSSYVLYGCALDAAGRTAEAAERLKAAVQLARELAQNNEGAYLPFQAHAMMLLAIECMEIGQEEEAAQHGRAAVDLARRLAGSNPVTFTLFLAQMLIANAGLLAGSEPRDADARLTEAVRACREVNAASTELGGPLMLVALLAQLELRLNQSWFREAVASADEGVELGRRLVQALPECRELLLFAMEGLREAHESLCNRAQALAVGHDLVSLLRQFAADNPDFLPDLAEALEALSDKLMEAGMNEQATELLRDAVEIHRGQIGEPQPKAIESAPRASAQRGRSLTSSTARYEPEALSILTVHKPQPQRVVLGRYNGALVAAAAFRPVLALGPQRSRKTTGVVIPTLLEWDGPAVVTSVRTDVIASTIEPRSRIGNVQIFEPTGRLYEGPATCQWDPLAECRDWNGAVQAAYWLTEAGADMTLREAEFWYNLAGQLLAPLLHAAAVSNRNMGHVYEWVKRSDEDEVEIALEKGDESARIAFRGIQELEDRFRSSIYGVLMTALSVYESENVRSMRRALFDVDTFFDGRPNTLYLCAPPDEQEKLAPLFTALVRRLIQEAYDRDAGGDHLNLLVLLDEAGNIAPLKNLDTLATTAAGTRIQLVTVFHDLSQMIAKYNLNSANTIANNHSALLVLPGNRDPATSDLVRNLLQDDPIQGEDGVSNRALRRLRPGTALCFYEQLPPTVIELRSSSHDADFEVLAKPIDDDPGGRWRRRRRIAKDDRPVSHPGPPGALTVAEEAARDAIAASHVGVHRPLE